MTESAHPLPDEEGRPAAGPSEEQPNWVVSPDQGAEDERVGPRRDPLRLTTSNDLSESVPVERPMAPARSARPVNEERSVGPTPWSAAASSVPKLKIGPVPPSEGETEFDQPLHPRPKAIVTPMPSRPVRTERVAPPDDDPRDLDVDAGFGDEQAIDSDGFPNDTPGAKAPPALSVRKLDEPFWVVAMDEMQSNPRLPILCGVGLLLIVATWMFWPRGEKGVSLHELRANATRFDAQTVRLNGRVGEVFNVGAGWAYYLHQGRDTIVVFTRGVPPRMRDKISVTGSVSTGYLDGSPRQAIFATP